MPFLSYHRESNSYYRQITNYSERASRKRLWEFWRIINMSGRSNLKNTRMNFKNQTEKGDSKGSKPTREASSVFEILVMMIMHVCKKSLFFDTNLKIAIYLGALFLLSLVADVLKFPKTYFSRSDNIFNLYFVKIGWFWTLLLTIPFVLMTAYTNCCGRRPRILKGHLTRIAIATVFWYCWTTFFNVIETNYGRCNMKAFDNKRMCLKNGHFWNGFDISGHCFILLYSSLVLIEEAKAIIGWESLKDYIRDEEYARGNDDKSPSTNPLRYLSLEELNLVRKAYEKFTPYVRALFIAISLLQILWDVMLVATILYYHIMVEKFVSGVIAILTWFVTYRAWYSVPTLFPNQPGEGIFKYNKDKIPTTAPLPKKRVSTAPNGKHFMGMPLYKAADSADEPTDDSR